MNRVSAIAVRLSSGLVVAALLGGCADLMQRSTIAPEWFQAKAVEVKGEGYPELKDIPQSRGRVGGASEWAGEATALRNEAAEIETKIAEAGEIPTDEAIRARAAQLRAQVEGEAADEDVQP